MVLCGGSHLSSCCCVIVTVFVTFPVVIDILISLGSQRHSEDLSLSVRLCDSVGNIEQ